MLRESLTGLVLAGGRGRRMAGLDKGLVPYQGRPLIQYALDALKPHTDSILINANRHLEAYQEFGFPVVTDADPDFSGPLSGIVAGMRKADCAWVLTLPCDMPKVTAELLQRLIDHGDPADAPLVIAHDGERLQPLLMLASTELAPSLQAYLVAGGRRVDQWVESLPHQIVDLSDARSLLVNLNDFKALDHAESN